MATIDLNADLGELPGPSGAELDTALLSVVTSANVACGGHAGDAASMLRVCRAAADQGVQIGAHVSYPDRAGFGRRTMRLPDTALAESLRSQLAALTDAADRAGTRVAYVKPHGALYHDAAADRAVAAVVVAVVAEADIGVLSLPDRSLLSVAREAQVEAYAEAFADRGYRADGSLVPRTEEGALLTDPTQVGERVLALAHRRPIATATGGPVTVTADSICLHGDTPGAVTSARVIARTLTDNGVTLRAFTADRL